MPLRGIKEQFKSYEKGFVLVECELTVGATGAVSSIDGKDFASGGTPSGDQGGIVRDGTGAYTITLPGTGGFQKIKPLEPQIIDGSASDVRHVLWTARTPSARTISVLFLDADTPAATDPANGSVICFSFLVKETTVR